MAQRKRCPLAKAGRVESLAIYDVRITLAAQIDLEVGMYVPCSSGEILRIARATSWNL